MNIFAPPQRLSRLQIEITTGCNLQCPGCQRTIGMAVRQWTNRHMPLERFAAILRHAPPADVLVLQGIGEPTLHPGVKDIITAARADGRYGVISFNSNALVREPEEYAELKSAGLNHLSVSVDSLDPAVAERTRTGTDTDKLRRMVPALIRLFGSGTTISIVLSGHNLSGLSALLAELHGFGARLIEVQPLIAYDPALEDIRLTPADIGRALAIIAEARARLPGLQVLCAPSMTPSEQRCTRPFRAGYVTVDGFLTPCCTTQDAALFGQANLAERAFGDLWQTPAVSRWFGRFFSRDDEICHGCTFNPSGADRGAGEALALKERADRAGAMQRDGKVEAAAKEFRAIVEQPGVLAALEGVGTAALQRGDFAAGAPVLAAVQTLSPSSRNALNLAQGLFAAGRRAEAIDTLRRTVAGDPLYGPAYRPLAAMMGQTGDRIGAAGVLNELCRKALAAGNATLVEAAVRELTALGPIHPATTETANLLRVGGRAELAAALLDKVLQDAPFDLGARLVRAMSALPVTYDGEAEIEQRRSSYAELLSDLDTASADAAPGDLAAAFEQVGKAKPFYLSYQGLDDSALQATYGRIVARFAQAAIKTPPATSAKQRGRIRVGFASHYFFFHSVSKLFRGWIERLDRERFEVIVYDFNTGAPDGWATAIGNAAAHVRRNVGDAAGWAKQIAADRLDVLVYPEIGMETVAVRLACLRLAPVQCVAWGHPVTTGLPEIDFFLSSALMEPGDGDSHYTERLVRLPNLSICYSPIATDTAARSRTSLGFDADDVVFVSCQSLYKYLPRFDGVFPAIASREPKARFLFLADAHSHTTERFKSRLARAFASAGLEAGRHVVIADRVPPAEFPSLLKAGDIYLDSLGWSGGNTSLEAATVGLPIVTLPGSLMRSRHTAAILWQMGLDRYVARDIAGYVGLAAELGGSAETRASAAMLISELRHKLFDDRAPIKALEDFLHAAVRAPDTVSQAAGPRDQNDRQGLYGPSALAASSTNSVTTMSL